MCHWSLEVVYSKWYINTILFFFFCICFMCFSVLFNVYSCLNQCVLIWWSSHADILHVLTFIVLLLLPFSWPLFLCVRLSMDPRSWNKNNWTQLIQLHCIVSYQIFFEKRRVHYAKRTTRTLRCLKNLRILSNHQDLGRRNSYEMLHDMVLK